MSNGYGSFSTNGLENLGPSSKPHDVIVSLAMEIVLVRHQDSLLFLSALRDLLHDIRNKHAIQDWSWRSTVMGSQYSGGLRDGVFG